MNEQDVSEHAYKNGYSAGYAAGRRSAGRKCGRWEDGHCTNCNHLAEVQNIGFNCTGGTKVNYKHTNYCPNCGADMRGKEDG